MTIKKSEIMGMYYVEKVTSTAWMNITTVSSLHLGRFQSFPLDWTLRYLLCLLSLKAGVLDRCGPIREAIESLLVYP